MSVSEIQRQAAILARVPTSSVRVYQAGACVFVGIAGAAGETAVDVFVGLKARWPDAVLMVRGQSMEEKIVEQVEMGDFAALAEVEPVGGVTRCYA